MTTPARQGSTELLIQLAEGTLAGKWTLDNDRSSAMLQSKSMWGLVPVKGVFRELSGTAVISPEGQVAGQISITANSIDTKNSKRDTHLRSADFFMSDKYPAITFTLNSLTPADEGASISGTLTVRDSSRPVTFPASASGLDDGAIALDATLQVDRSEFGLSWNQLGMSSMKNTITIHAVFTRG